MTRLPALVSTRSDRFNHSRDGSLGNRSGSLAAAFVRSPLLGDPWFMNDTPWGPLDTVNTIVATTIPNVPAPSTPGASPLFT